MLTLLFVGGSIIFDGNNCTVCSAILVAKYTKNTVLKLNGIGKKSLGFTSKLI